MEKALLILFLVLFFGRSVWRFILQQLNIRHLQKHGKDIPPAFRGIIDADTLSRMVDYTIDNTRLAAKENLADDAVELFVLFFVLPVLVGAIAALKINLIGQALLFFGILAVIGVTAGLPFDLYHTFVLEKKYGFTTITWRLWLADLLKSLMLSAMLAGILLGAFMTFILCWPTSWWFWAWIFFTLFEVLLLWMYPVVIAPLFNKYEPVKNAELQNKIISLLAEAGLNSGGIYQVDEGKRTRHTNAYFTGIGKTKRIVLFDTLLASHSTEEILAVLAHEIGHWKKKHILKQLVFLMSASLVLFYGVYLAVSWPPLYLAFGIAQTPVYAGFFLVSLYLSAAGFFLSPIGAAITRRFEREADRMAFELTGTSRPMVDALRRLAKDNLSNLHPHPWYVRFYYSHPPLTERIEYLQAMGYKNGKPGE